jgi:hypothetical protein
MSNALMCKKCHDSIVKDDVSEDSVSNGFDFGEIPTELSDLTLLEQILISRIRVRYTIVKLQMSTIKHGDMLQKAIRGNVIAFPQNVDEIHQAVELPCSIEDVPSLIKIILVGNVAQRQRYDLMSKFGKVRRDVVLRAINWKIHNDPHYADVQVNINFLSLLPEDDILSCVIETVSEVNTSEHTNGDDSERPEYIPIEHVGYVDFSGLSISSEVLEKTGFANAVLRVPHGLTPVSEYQDSYWPGAFPVLFPYGRGLPNEPRKKPVTFIKWLRHCLNYMDHRFRKHPTFIFVSFLMLNC